MDILVKVFLPLVLAFIMFSLGLGLTLGDFVRVLKRPKAFGIGAFNQVLLLPVVTFAVVIGFGISAEMAVGFMILSACPGGVTSNVISKLAKADVALSVSLTAVISLLSAITVPLLIGWSTGYFLGSEAPPINVSSIAFKMFILTIVPIALGITVRHFLPAITGKIEPMISGIATILFGIVVVAALASNWSLFTKNVAIMGPALIVLIVALLFLGMTIARLSGLTLHEAKTISIETGIQNSTLGITAASLLIAGSTGLNAYALPAAVYGILMYLITLPVVVWYRSLK
ncbi:MAG: bile acid:sodium symporter family protein [Methyloligellaceae bacterium]